jgi:hypothetical protein
MILCYKIHLETFNVISIVLYHSGPTFGKIFYSCLDAIVFYASDYSGHLIRHLLNASEAFTTEWRLGNKSKSGGLSPKDFDFKKPLCGKRFRGTEDLKKPLRGKRFRSIEVVSNEVT